jgi:hypothetical protein
MLAVPAMLSALPHLEAMRSDSIAVAAARTTRADVVNRQADPA